MPRNNKYLELVGKLEKKLATMKENSLLPPEIQIAEEFGVSKPTLRRALQVMVDAGQIRKINGVGIMVTKPARTISRELIFLCYDIAFFAETLKYFGDYALKQNYFISIVPLIGDAQTQERIIMSVIKRNPAGVAIYADPQNNQLSAFNNLVAKNITSLYLIRLPYGINNNLLEFSNAGGVTEIVKTFYKRGCRRIAFYSDAQVNPAASTERENGFIEGMKKCRLLIRPELWCPRNASSECIERFLELFTDSSSRPDAVCCMNDYCAGKLMKTLLKRKIDIDNICFSGFDNSPLSEFIPQPLLTVIPPMAKLGKTAAEILIKQVENPQFGFLHKKLHTTIINTEE